ncbi:MAG: methionyl-tRNA formyltransferase [Deltaproteobacteria bacterium]|nr:methionyl-tRNA formyltransferase [Deltaproteobacteria bacterium]
MGTPDFAVPALKALHDCGQNVALVVTQPDRPRGRGRKVHPPPVKTTALNLELKFVQPQSIRTPEFDAQVKQINPDFIVVAAFGNILPSNILAIPQIGTINIHASLLPSYRGPAPINWAIINGESRTGVTTMLVDEGVDTGDILLTAEETITARDTAATLHDRLALIGADLLIKTIAAYADDSVHPVTQDDARATYAPMLKKEDGHINWQQPAEALDPLIRGMTPWPGAFTFHEKNRLKIFSAKPVDKSFEVPPGTVLPSFPDELEIATGKNALSILEIQGPSGKRLQIKDFLRGYKIEPGTQLK